MTIADKYQRADDIIGLMAGFGFSLIEARSVAAVIYSKLATIEVDDYNLSGDGVAAMAAMLDKRDGIEQDAVVQSRIFHEPRDAN